ncbi:TonB-dependent receptor plug domain-containing protein [Pseudoduganella sp. OTU4001]|uniref:TonB-dependent receptor plug domain-containing protein n=1 Tax=Pseudoduganella sp. OTU4001 TaxID=3043854 RepID=UPI00313B32A5
MDTDLFNVSVEALLDMPFSTASRQTLSARDAPAVISVITAEDIRQFGYRSVAEALVQVPGMYAISDRVAPNVGVRGINAGVRAWSRILKVMIDGQPLAFRSDASNFLGPSLLNMEAVERIEVVRGPASALYGADAFLGVVNIITRPGDQRHHAVTASYSGGGEQGAALALHGQAQRGPWQFMVALAGANLEREDAALPASSPLYRRVTAAAGRSAAGDDDTRPRNALLRLAYAAPAHDTTLMAHAYRLDSDAQFLDFGILSRDNRVALYQRTARLQHEYRGWEGWTLRASAAHTQGEPDGRERLSLGAAASYPQREIGFSEQAYNLEVQHRIGEMHSVVLGLDRSRDREERMRVYSVDAASGKRTLVSGTPASERITNSGAYLQYSIRPWSWLGLTANLRRDRHSVFGADNNYRLALVGSLSPTLHYKLLHGTSYKAPTAAQLYAQPLYAGEVLGNRALRPETSVSTEASVSWQATPALALSANAYQLTVRDKTELLPLGANLQPQNSGRHEGKGWEGEALWQTGAQRWRAQLAWADTEDHFQPRLQPVQVTPTASYPRLVARVSWQYLHAALGQVAVSARHVSPRRASKVNSQENLLRPYQLASYALADVNWQRSLGRHTLALRVSNLFDRQYAEPGYGGIDLPGEGRTATISYSYRF